MKVVPNERLFVSQPDPRWFGNGPNDNTASSGPTATG